MGGISTGVGIFSGLDTGQIISQLLAISSRPKILAQQRIAQLQVQQSGYMDINSRLQTLQNVAASLRTQNIFQTHRATSSAPEVLTATATTNAREGVHSFIVDRLVSTQQFLSRGFLNSNSTGLGATSISFESAEARLDRDTNLANLNGGSGVSRGKITITDSAGGAATVDLSRVGTVSEVLSAINSAAGVQVRASVRDGAFIIEDRAGGAGTMQIANVATYTTADSLGIAKAAVGGVITGDRVHGLTEQTALSQLNDGNGIFVGNVFGEGAWDFDISIGGAAAIRVNLGAQYSGSEVIAPAAATIGDVIDRINEAMGENYPEVTASIDATGTRLVINDTQNRMIELTNRPGTLGNTLADLGLATDFPTTGTLTGTRILADMNSTLASRLLGGTGLSALGNGQLDMTLRDGTNVAMTLDLDTSMSSIARQIETASGTLPGGGPRLTVTVNDTGTGLLITDHTGGSGNLRIEGAGGGDTAVALGISTGAAGVASNTVSGSNLQHQYISYQTQLSTMNQGRGIGTGVMRITDSLGVTREIDVGTDAVTLGDLAKEINSAGSRVKARINDGGDGLLLYEDTGGGSVKIKVEDVSGSVARNLRILGEAEGTGNDNFIDGSGEQVVELAANDTLSQIMAKINAANVGVSATIINDGNGATPYRLSLTARSSGTAGRMIVDSGSFDLGLTTLDAGRDARVFFGASDPALGVLLQSSTNTLDRVIEGVSIDLTGVKNDPVTLTISKDTSAIENKIKEFVDAFNDAASRIQFHTRFDTTTNQRGSLIGDSTAQSLRRSLFDTVLGTGLNLSGTFDRLTDVGITMGSGGVLALDVERLRDALEEDAESVEALFTARELAPKDPVPVNPSIPGITVRPTEDTFLSLGVLGRIEELAKRFVNTVDGVLPGRRQSLDAQIQSQNQRISLIDAQLANRRSRLEQQFLAMERAIAQLQGQQSSLSGIQRVR